MVKSLNQTHHFPWEGNDTHGSIPGHSRELLQKNTDVAKPGHHPGQDNTCTVGTATVGPDDASA